MDGASTIINDISLNFLSVNSFLWTELLERYNSIKNNPSDIAKMEFSQNMDRIRKTSTDDEEEISEDGESAEVMRTDMLEGESSCPSLKLSTESLLECLKNVADIQPEPDNLDENDNYVVQEKIVYLVEQLKAIRKYQCEKIHKEMAAIMADIETIEYNENEGAVKRERLEIVEIRDTKKENPVKTKALKSKLAMFQDEKDDIANVSPMNDLKFNKETPEGLLKTDNEDEKKEHKANSKPRSKTMTPTLKFKFQKKNSFWKRKGSFK